MRLPTAGITRRRLLQASSALPLAAVIQDATPAPSLRGTHLRVLMPAHPLSSYNEALRTLATTWSAETGVSVDLDLVPAAEIAPAFAAEREIGAGHDLVASHLPMLDHADDLRDLADLAASAAAAFGPVAAPSEAATGLPDGSRPAFSLAYAPAPLLYRRSVWDAYGLPNGPATWTQLRETGALIWKEEGLAIGFGLSPEPGSERFAAMLLAAHGGALVDDSGDIALDSPETVEAVRFAVDLFREAMSPESLAWTTDRPARLLGDGIVSIVSDDLSALRLAQSRNGEIANDIFLAAPPAGPARTQPTTLPTSFRAFHLPRFAANPDAATAFLLMLAGASEALTGSSQLGDRPAYGSLVPGLVQAGGWLDRDPYGAQPPEKLALLKGSAAWTVAPRTALEARAHGSFLLARMLARAARDQVTPEGAVADAAAELREMT